MKIGGGGFVISFNPLNAELNPICLLLALLGAHHILHVSRIRVKVLSWISLEVFEEKAENPRVVGNSDGAHLSTQ